MSTEKTSGKTHLFQGEIIGDEELPGRLAHLDEVLAVTLPEALSTESVVAACDAMSRRLRAGELPALVAALAADGIPAPEAILRQLADAMSADALRKKLVAELGTDDPFTFRRVDYESVHFERWSPLGVLVHITAGNSPVVAPMAAVEGLLSGNINLIKVAGNAGDFPVLFLAELAKAGNLGKFLTVLRVSSSQKDVISTLLNAADCVSAWGGEEAIAALREMTPRGVPMVVWGHKISFAYVTPARLSPEVCDGIVKSACRNDQQSCSSPQVALIDTRDPAEVARFARGLAEAFERARALYPDPAPDPAQSAEITTVTELHRADLCFHGGEVIEPADKQYRLLVSDEPKFMPSPLFQTLWVSPLPHDELVARLRGMRGYLQTAGLACAPAEIAALSEALSRAGVSRITPVDSMSASYEGEPHDGVFALPRLLKRVALRPDSALDLADIDSFEVFRKRPRVSLAGRPIQGKKDYPPIPPEGTRVLMKSGGTTGAPVFCSYTQRDYENYIVRAGLRGFLAAGLDPVHDVVADFFKAGNLYGGLNAMISIFDRLHAPHLRISGLDDYALAARYAITGRATVLIGAPSYITRLLQENEADFKAYGRIRKIFFGGEHMSEGQRRYFAETFGIEHVRSLLYGANETGTMGYACPFCGDAEFHLCGDIQHLEILQMDSDAPAAPGEIGRLLFTGFLRENGHTERYEIGDTGCWLDEAACPCGRRDPRFRLAARYGDVIRMGGTFFNYQRMARILSSAFHYAGRLQLLLSRDGLAEVMTLCVENCDLTAERVARAFLDEPYDSFEKTLPNGLIRLEVRHLKPDEFIINQTSTKLRAIVDRR